MGQRQQRWQRWIETVITVFGNLGAYVFIPLLIAVSVYDIVGRQFFDTGSTKLQELEWHFFFATLMFGLGLTYWQDRHVRIDLFRNRLSARGQAWIELIGYGLFVIPFALVLIWFGTDSAWRAWDSGERARAALGLSYRWIIKSVVPLGGLLLWLAGTLVCWKNIQLLRGHRPQDV